MGGGGGATNVQFPWFLASPILTEASQLEVEGGRFLDQGGQLMGYLQSGTLPPGLMSRVEGSTQAAQQGVTAQYAAHGGLGSSGLALSSGDVQRAKSMEIGQLGTELFQLGLQESGLGITAQEGGISAQEHVMDAFIGVDEFNAQQNLEKQQANDSMLGSIGGAFGSILGAI